MTMIINFTIAIDFPLPLNQNFNLSQWLFINFTKIFLNNLNLSVYFNSKHYFQLNYYQFKEILFFYWVEENVQK